MGTFCSRLADKNVAWECVRGDSEARDAADWHRVHPKTHHLLLSKVDLTPKIQSIFNIIKL